MTSPYGGTMKIIHRIKALFLRRRLVRQRAENIKDLRAGRRAAKSIKVELARETRLSGIQEHPAKIQKNTAMPFHEFGKGNMAPKRSEGRISSILANMPRLERLA